MLDDTCLRTRKKIALFGGDNFTAPQYSPELSSEDYQLFCSMKDGKEVNNMSVRGSKNSQQNFT